MFYNPREDDAFRFQAIAQPPLKVSSVMRVSQAAALPLKYLNVVQMTSVHPELSVITHKENNLTKCGSKSGWYGVHAMKLWDLMFKQTKCV